jgi:LPS-assembly protein
MRGVALFAAAAILAGAGEMVVYGTKLEGHEGELELSAPFSLEYQKDYFEAEYGRYDQKRSLVFLRNRLDAIHNGSMLIYGESGVYDLDKQSVRINNFFLSDTTSNVWMRGEVAKGTGDVVEVYDARVSSCRVGCSDWQIGFKEGRYDRARQWVDLYHVAFYIKDTPLLYLPYFGFSTSKERKSGFLRPTVGYSGAEGFLYMQPYFYAPASWWDLEIDPQIRTKRGKGVYATLRFVDSAYSWAKIDGGLFWENESYRKKHLIKHRLHRGVCLRYERSNLFTLPGDDNEHQDGLLVDAKLYNDVEYFTLESMGGLDHARVLETSLVNYYYSSDQNYLDITARMYKYNDERDDEPIHILPSIRYDRYLEPLIEEQNLIYSLDAVATNYYQEAGIKAQEYRLTLPMKFYTDLFDEYLGLSFGSEAELLYVDYGGAYISKDGIRQKDYKLFRNTAQIALYGDVAKGYDEFYHVISYDVRWVYPEVVSQSGERGDFIYLLERTRHIQSSLRQFVYANSGEWDGYLFLSHRLHYEDRDEGNDLIGELGVHSGNFGAYLNHIYSFAKGHTKSWSAMGSYSKPKAYDVSLSYIYHKNDELDQEWRQRGRFFVAMGRWQFGRGDEVYGSVAYNLEAKEYKGWSVGWSRGRKCWGVSLEYSKDTRPQITSNGLDFYRTNTFMVRLELYPLGAISKSFLSTTGRKEF